MYDSTTHPIFGVGELNQFVHLILEGTPELQNVYVRGEISNFKNHYSTGHYYFSLKDEEGVVSSVMFRANAQMLRFKPEEGMKVIAHGRISLYVKGGSYQLYVDRLVPDGIGALYIAFNQLKNQLEAEGLFKESAKKPLPAIPERIGVVTSATGAVIQDIRNVISRRFPLCEICLYPALVQGPGAAQDLIGGIRYFNEHPGDADVIIIGRGGGSIEDLWAFNDEGLARAIHASKIPVISAVGHETDFTICDFVSDRRAPTPSAAAELAVPDRAELQKRLLENEQRAAYILEKRISAEKERISRILTRPVMLSPMGGLYEKQMQLDQLTDRYMAAFGRNLQFRRSKLAALESRSVFSRPFSRIENHRTVLLSLSDRREMAVDAKKRLRMEKVSHLEAQLKALSPLGVLNRGYSLLWDKNKKLIRSVSVLNPGDLVTLRMCDGTALTEIKKTEDNHHD